MFMILKNLSLNLKCIIFKKPFFSYKVTGRIFYESSENAGLPPGAILDMWDMPP